VIVLGLICALVTVAAGVRAAVALVRGQDTRILLACAAIVVACAAVLFTATLVSAN
jgi:hypothetical protein